MPDQPQQTSPAPADCPYDYDQAFSRHRGLIDVSEQERLKCTRVAIAGVGGIGGHHAATLARTGLGRFVLADFDHYELHNMNRQYGASIGTLGRNKAEVMRDILHGINPEAEVRLMTRPLDRNSIDPFLEGADIVIDALDIMAQTARRALLAAARERGIPAFSAAPLGFGGAVFHYHPEGMSYDEFAGLEDGMSERQMLLHFLCAIGAQGPHLKYMDTSGIGCEGGTAPSLGLACQIGACMVATDVVAHLLGRRTPRWVPRFAQFDPYGRSYRERYRPWGARNPLQRLRMAVLRRRLPALAQDQPVAAAPAGQAG